MTIVANRAAIRLYHFTTIKQAALRRASARVLARTDSTSNDLGLPRPGNDYLVVARWGWDASSRIYMRHTRAMS